MLDTLIIIPKEPIIRQIEDRRMNTSETVKLAGRSTLVKLLRISNSSGEVLDEFTAPLGEALDEGRITDTCKGTTVRVNVQLDDSEDENFWNQPLDYIPTFKTYEVYQPDPFEQD